MPFTVEQFLRVFSEYNAAIWPAQFLLVGAALVALYFAIRGGAGSAMVAPLILAALWVWSGAVYHLGFFRHINPLAIAFGVLFIAQGVLLVVAARRQHLALAFRPTVTGWLGAGLIVYALVVYPLVGAMMGHWYPNSPTFGAPCPLTIFTLGLLLWNARVTPWYAVVVPVVWSAIGTAAALSLGMEEDFGLAAAGAIALAVFISVRAKHKPRPAVT